MTLYDFICTTLALHSITRTTNTLILKGQCMAAMDLSIYFSLLTHLIAHFWYISESPILTPDADFSHYLRLYLKPTLNFMFT
ncbi:hypothetical protein FJMB80151_22730 [Enterobacter hormaechei]|nr:hypothetical protein FJMB80063_23010 [Enterobacter hormaechei]BDK30675.1 hypothetical protein FJMB80068_22390 [Enterobacter hormaechei]BDK35761.1 hypothetical protein FJMB80144_22720 [Enterobacter hormaechei]BDK40960.1 hypothetical protein FJMB80145_22730 [Enterobacter hormaechei]BDK46166.1 hypothetical protein FJMB80146_22750 [Enterobacter hormaechei]